ncbi:acyltransferase [Pseudonocardia sp. C8]|uniref:acyltransferase family protein n=1 Tax=Pseudonocardia sp. C8 TaxID=2762759 RepID=UPI0016431922|nr:acyltransferase [Pseudonocardia sp. C8]MBC3191213.1 acyltransferase [Pseudonocardia sp. C8]
MRRTGERPAAAGEPLVEQAGRPRMARVESLRALAVLGVVLAHTMFWSSTPPRAADPVERTLVLGSQVAPFVLFVLSGCLLYGPFARRDLGSGGQICLRRYALNRAVRILPVYYAALVAALLVRGGGTAREWLLYATFGQNLVIAPNDQVNRVMWFMVIEVHFYLALPLLAALVGRLARGSRARAVVVLAVSGAASFGLFHVVWHVDPDPWTALQFSLPSTFFFLAAGMALAVLRLHWDERPGTVPGGVLGSADVWIGAAVLLVAVLVVGRLQVPATGAMAVLTAIGVLLVGACVLPLRPGPLVRILRARPLAVVGVASYSLLLCHEPILEALATSGWSPSWSGLLAVGLPLSLLTAWLGYVLIEAPFLRLRRRWIGTGSATPAHPVPSRTPEGDNP